MIKREFVYIYSLTQTSSHTPKVCFLLFCLQYLSTFCVPCVVVPIIAMKINTFCKGHTSGSLNLLNFAKKCLNTFAWKELKSFSQKKKIHLPLHDFITNVIISKTGALFFGIAALESLATTLSRVIFHPVYTATNTIFHGTVYLALSAFYIVSLVFSG